MEKVEDRKSRSRQVLYREELTYTYKVNMKNQQQQEAPCWESSCHHLVKKQKSTTTRTYNPLLFKKKRLASADRGSGMHIIE